MKRIYRRTIASLLILALFLTGYGIYLVKYAVDGGDWVTFAVNSHAYTNGILTTGSVYDAEGEMLSGVEDGGRVFSDDYTIRRATLHVVGDAQGNIGTGMLTSHATDLIGYDFVNGAYSRTGQGNDLYLTLDSDACAAALNALGGRKGAVVVYNYKTGAVVCMVSAPGFDPADPPEIKEGDARYDGAYINRAISSTFTPGSIFKIVTLAAAIENIDDLFSRQFTCEGSTEIAGETINCSGTHGTIDIYGALADSCNCAFSELALELGGATLQRYAARMGLTDSFSIDGIPVAAGAFEEAPVGSANLGWSGIGQYRDLVNPLAFARLMGAVANGGRAVEPYLIGKITTPAGLPLRVTATSAKRRLLSSSTAEVIRGMMRNDVENAYGDWRFPDLTVCAKSGTAELESGETPHAWFAGFLDDEENPYAFCVFVENGGWGVSVAGAVANTVLQELVYG
ncbi:MAG: penicillin-binding transpeptidase domain-containing protein [Oscillospiraceae bacterium]|nr:penicillin-binding transpeptidase domain-containing protein [Oscillospiraceae bacterium]